MELFISLLHRNKEGLKFCSGEESNGPKGS